MLERLKKINKIYPLISFVLSLLLLVIIFSFLNIIGYGNDSIFRGDLTQQYYAFIIDFLNCLKGDSSIWYSFGNYLGSGNILNIAYYAINPFNFIYLISDTEIGFLTIVIIFLKISLAALTFELFVQKIINKDNPFYILISLFYGISGYVIIMHFNMMWLDIVYILPILILCLINFIRKGSYFGLTLCYTYAFLTNFYMAYMAGIFSAIVFVLYLLYINDFKIIENIKKILLTCVKYAGVVILSVAMSAFILIPTFFFLMSHIAEDNFTFSELSATIFDLFNTLYIGQIPTLDNQVPFLYCGILVAGLCIYFFFDKNIKKNIKICFGVVLSIYLVCMTLLPAYEFMHAFDYPNFYGYRFAFVLIFVFCVMACIVIEHYKEINFRFIKWLGFGSIIFYSVMITYQLVVFSNVRTNDNNGLLINALFIIIWCVILFLFQNKEQSFGKVIKNIFYAFVIIFACAEICINSYICVKYQDFFSLSDTELNQLFFSEKEAIESINDDGFYRVQVNNEWFENACKLFNYNGLTTFSSSDNYTLRMALSRLGLATSNRTVLARTLVPGFDSMFSVKYEVTIPDFSEWEDQNITKDNYLKADVIERENILSLGYMVRPEVKEYAHTDNSFDNIENLFNLMSGLDEEIYNDIPLDEFEIVGNNVAYEDCLDYFMTYPKSEAFGGGTLAFTIEDDDQEIYCNFYQENPLCAALAPGIEAERDGCISYLLTSMGGIYRLSVNEDGKRQIRLVSEDSYSFHNYIKNISFATFNKDAFENVYSELSANQYIIDVNRDDLISGTITATEDKNIMFTSIPVDPGWQVFVDGAPAEVVPVIEGAFMGVELEPGTHTVTFIYIESYSVIATLISVFSAVLFVLLVVMSLIDRFKNKNKNEK